MDESQQEDCTVYIQQLKSDNPSLKLNAATKIPVIGSVLGHNRIKEQLIPYLIEIIEQMDNDNQFLMKVSEGILELKRYCSTALQISSLIYPLRVLASLDQPPVRDKAVNCLKNLAQGQNKQFYEKYFYPLINTLCQKQGAYAPKIAACFLIPSTYVNLSEEKQVQFRKLFKSLALEEGGPLIRRAIAENIQDFAKGVDKKIIRGDFYDIWNSLISDTFDIIKIKALQCAVIIARAFKKEEITDKFFKQIRFVDSGKKSWRVRYSLIQCLAAMLPYLEKDIIKKDVVQAFQELLKDQETQVRAIALIKLSQLTQKISQQQAWNVFFQYIQKAGKDSNKEAVPTVKLALVEAIVPYFRTVDKSNVIEAGIPILATLLKDQNQSIRSGIMLRIMELSDIVGPEGTVKYLLPLIQGCLNDKKWRFKLAISQNIPNFFKALNYEENKEFLDKLVTSFLKDHNYAVREQTIKSLSASKPHLTSQRYFQLIQRYLNQMVGQVNYIYRVTGCIFLREVQNLQKSQLNQIFSTLIKKMQSQKIANVLVAFFITYSKIKGQLNSTVKKEFQALLNKVKEEKQDEDVLYYASKVQE